MGRLSLGSKRDPIRMCVDMLPNPKEANRFARLAIKENPANEPFLVGVPPTPSFMAMITSKKWDVGRTLGVAFLDGGASNQALVKKTAAQWADFANIKFEFGVSPSEAEIRISFRQQGAWSYIGTDALGIHKNQPTMNFGFIDPGTILHEFGHALGCIHEHQHPQAGIPWNREAVYAYYGGPPNNWDRATIDSNIFGKYSTSITQFSQYDPKSIMHYPIDPRLTTGGFKVDINQTLSAADKAFIATAYPGRTSPDTPGSPTETTIGLKGTYIVQNVGGKQAIVLTPG
jgi:serralysin